LKALPDAYVYVPTLAGAWPAERLAHAEPAMLRLAPEAMMN